jgi:hypothetical protein
MAIPHLYASSYQKRMESGRTRPCIFFCEDNDGEIGGEYVVKLKAGLENWAVGSMAELMASQLALFLDIPTPEPAIIRVDPELADIIPDEELANTIRESAGLNFGSKLVTPGFETWPVGEQVPVSLIQLAGEIFAFDALIQNPDRKNNKPNILWKGDELYIIDHEMGFSFVYPILGQDSSLDFLKDHLFYQSLKAEEINFDRFAGALESLSTERLNDMIANIPEEWNNEHITTISRHISNVTNHVNDFIDEVRRTLQ